MTMPYTLKSADQQQDFLATPYAEWSDGQFMLAAQLTLDPTTNGGFPSEVQPEAVVQLMKVFPCPWLLVESESGALLCGMNPYNGQEGSLHLAARGFSVHNAIHLLRHFTDQFPNTQIYAFTIRPPYEAITRRLGFTLGARDGEVAIWKRPMMHHLAAGRN
ncbi:hypothetical protein DKM44_14040 [Deinococcus irradiatisoli]|uniref:Uncharacterized protein n=1 Tax=Deinococcus irradiatisoli TaxID=2202254 RepID=A0A2Z3JGU1_9DEIO|nr:hypothetical protein [Deinococcus irradiatisoli]AWN24212.1 hypothetical protein DKM44_14040 [Deinococcus irradiatisoli]